MKALTWLVGLLLASCASTAPLPSTRTAIPPTSQVNQQTTFIMIVIAIVVPAVPWRARRASRATPLARKRPTTDRPKGFSLVFFFFFFPSPFSFLLSLFSLLLLLLLFHHFSGLVTHSITSISVQHRSKCSSKWLTLLSISRSSPSLPNNPCSLFPSSPP